MHSALMMFMEYISFCLNGLNLKDMEGLISDSSLLASTYVAKGKGGGKSSLGKGSLGKGSLGKGSLGKGRGNDEPPAPKSPEELLEEAQNKCRKMRDVCGKCLANMEETVQAAKKSKYWTKVAQKDADGLMAKMAEEIQALNKVIGKNNIGPDELKEWVLKAASVVKECQSAVKEYKQLANKTASVLNKGTKR